MKKNTSTIIATAAIIAFVVGGFYLMSRGSSSPQGNTAGGDPMHGGATASSGSLNDLIGKPVPQFSLRDRNGVEYSSDNLKGKNVVLFFNEGIMCYPACWNQMISLATDPRFNSADTAAFSVVIDNPGDWQNAIRKMPDLGKATVLFDSDKSVSRRMGMLTVPSSMHYGSYPGHSFVLVDSQGIVRSVFDDPNMGIDNDRVATDLQKLN
ncbi:MAG: redoxin family protein [Candidatus Liptonbacteria bacterium]|nr:redoxin family protein [Candidatus Liptonbacteria bacterium]